MHFAKEKSNFFYAVELLCIYTLMSSALRNRIKNHTIHSRTFATINLTYTPCDTAASTSPTTHHSSPDESPP